MSGCNIAIMAKLNFQYHTTLVENTEILGNGCSIKIFHLVFNCYNTYQ